MPRLLSCAAGHISCARISFQSCSGAKPDRAGEARKCGTGRQRDPTEGHTNPLRHFLQYDSITIRRYVSRTGKLGAAGVDHDDSHRENPRGGAKQARRGNQHRERSFLQRRKVFKHAESAPPPPVLRYANNRGKQNRGHGNRQRGQQRKLPDGLSCRGRSHLKQRKRPQNNRRDQSIHRGCKEQRHQDRPEQPDAATCD